MSEEQEPGREARGSHDATSLDPAWGAQNLETDLSVAERTGVVKPPAKTTNGPSQKLGPSAAELHARQPHAVDDRFRTGVDLEGPGSAYRRPAPIESQTEDGRNEPLSLAERMGFVKRPQVDKSAPVERSLPHRPAVSNPDEILD
jgi:hypothetical protein